VDHSGKLQKVLRRDQPQVSQGFPVARVDVHERHQDAFRLSGPASNSTAAANTSSGVSSVMQRWSSGQTRNWHGPQATFFCKWTAAGWYVSVQAMCVGPNSVTTGRPNAAAKWRGPLSVVTSRLARHTQAFVSPTDS